MQNIDVISELKKELALKKAKLVFYKKIIGDLETRHEELRASMKQNAKLRNDRYEVLQQELHNVISAISTAKKKINQVEVEDINELTVIVNLFEDKK